MGIASGQWSESVLLSYYYIEPTEKLVTISKQEKTVAFMITPSIMNTPKSTVFG